MHAKTRHLSQSLSSATVMAIKFDYKEDDDNYDKNDDDDDDDDNDDDDNDDDGYSAM